MVYDPVTTFVVYIVAILVVLTVCAIAADLWGAQVERRDRLQARAEERARRREERGS